MDGSSAERFRQLLCGLQDAIRDRLVAARAETVSETLAAIVDVTAADTIYHIDRVSESVVFDWFDRCWPTAEPVELVMEGGKEGTPCTFPRGRPLADCRWVCIIDPVDGTRTLMYDKRSAWTLAAIAPRRPDGTRLADLKVAAMTELPCRKQWASDQISGVRGGGRPGLVVERVDVRTGSRTAIDLKPSQGTDFHHAFASFSRFFPAGKSLLAELEESLWRELYGNNAAAGPVVFDDQYLASSGQLYELMAGHDRMIGDLRPQVYQRLGLQQAITCHPYDLCTSFLLEEAGGVVESPLGGPLDAPLDTTTTVGWVGFANQTLARLVRPVLHRLIRERLL
jgi:hypothetical protein